MSRQREVRLLIRELMERPEWKHLSYTDILNAVYWGQFGFVNKMITGGDKANPESFKSTRLNYLGSFIAHPKRVEIATEYFKKHGKYNKDRDNNEESSE